MRYSVNGPPPVIKPLAPLKQSFHRNFSTILKSRLLILAVVLCQFTFVETTVAMFQSEKKPKAVESSSPLETIYFSDGFENGLVNWIVSGQDWDTTSSTSRSGKYSVTDSRVGNYPSNANESITLAVPLNLSSSVSPVLRYWHKYSLGSYDDCYVEVSTNGGSNWTQLADYYSSSNGSVQSTWTMEQLDLNYYRGSSVTIRFRLHSDASSGGDGWYIDDVSIKEIEASASLPFVDGFENGLVNWIVSGQDWDTTTASSRGGRYAITESRTGNYPLNANEAITLAVPLNLSSAVSPVLRYWHKYSLGSYDDCYVEVSTNGGSNWSQLVDYYASSSGDVQTAWMMEQVDLKNYRSSSVKIRFRLKSDGSGNDDGWSIDDVSIKELEASASLPFADGFENGLSNWVVSGRGWDTTSATSRSGKFGITDSRTGNYPLNENETIILAVPLNLSSSVSPVLRYWHKYSLGSYDDCFVEISTNGGSSWVQLTDYYSSSTGSVQSTWTMEQLDLKNYRASSVKIRFRLRSDGTGNGDGWFIDDVSVKELEASASLPFSDGFENGLGNWIVSGQDWDTTTASSRGGRYAITESRMGNYPVNANEAVTLAIPLDLSSTTSPVLRYWHKYSLGSYDNCFVEISTNGGSTWTQLVDYYSSSSGDAQSTWMMGQIDLKNYRSSSVKVRFRLQSDGSGVADGWYIDDISISELEASASLPFSDGFENGLVNWIVSGRDWDTTSATSRSGKYAITDSRVGNYPSNANEATILAIPLDLSSATSPVLRYWHKYALGSYDDCIVEISTNGGSNWTQLVDHYSSSSGSIQSTWTMEQFDLKNYRYPSVKIRFRLQSDGSGVDDGWSIDDVLITDSPSIKLLAPNGGEVLQPGATFSINWIAVGVSGTRLDYSINDTTNWVFIANAATTTDKYAWLVPSVSSSRCRIRISDVANNSFNDVSDNFFSISSAAAILPSATTSTASTITSSSAVLNGSINPNGSSTTAYFEWGTSSTLSSYSSTTPQSVGSGTGAVAITADLTGLTPSTAYYYRVVGQNAGGTQKGSIVSFTTATSGTLLGEYSPDANTVLLLHMNETSGSTASDASSYGNNGTATRTTIDDGRFGKTRRFNYPWNEYVTIPQTTSLKPSGDLTVECWVKPAYSHYGPVGGQSPNLIVHWASALSMFPPQLASDVFAFVVSTTTGSYFTYSKTKYDSLNWFHVAGVYRSGGLNSSLKLYINGQLEDSVYTPNSSLSYGVSVLPLYIGIGSDHLTDGYRQFWGLMDEVRISSIVRSPQEFSLQLPPKYLTAIASGTSISLSWQNGGGAIGLLRYKIYRGTDSTNVTLIDSTSTTSYTNTGLTTGVRYFYRITAVDLTGFEGTQSYAASATIGTTGIPPTAVSLSATGIGLSVASLNGTVNPNGYSTTAFFEWGTDGSLSSYNSTSNQPIGAGTSPVSVTANLSGLNPNATYYYRAVGQNSYGTQRGSIVSFSTNAALPTVSTSSGSSVTVTSAKLSSSVNPNGSSTSAFFEWGTNSTLSSYSTTASQSIGSGTTSVAVTADVSGLNANTTYYYRGAAQNSAGTVRGSIVSFSTLVIAPPAVSPSSPSNGASNQPLTVTLSWGSASGATRYRLQLSSSSSFSSLLVDDSTLTSTSKQVGPLSYGMTYYWRVSASNAGGSSPYSSTASFTTIPAPATTLTVNTSVSFPTKQKRQDYATSDYRLFGLPGDAIAVSSVLSGTSGTDWQMYWDNGASSNYQVAYDGSNTFQFGNGRAFWLISNSNISISRTVNGPSQNQAYEVEISLHAGWNMITNPFAAAIPWSRMQTANGITGTIQTYNGSWAVASSFDPYVGYYFFNASPQLSVLKVPYYSLYGDMGEPPGKAFNGWKVSVALSSDGVMSGETYFGVSVGAEQALDEFDIRKPRALGAINDVYFDRPEWDHDYPTFAADIRGVMQQTEEWNFKASAEPNRSSTLRFTGIQGIPAQYEAFLLDRGSGKSINLRTDSSYAFISPLRTTEFTVVVGTKESVLKKTLELLPTEFCVGQNFPNPFNPTTSVRVTVPVRSQIRLMIYNLLGQRVSTLYEGVVDAGIHWYTWNGKDEHQSDATSGVYFCRLEADGGRPSIVRMILMK